MITFGIYPLSGLAIGGCLYAVYYFLLRLRCKPQMSQLFIFAAVVLTTIYTFISPVRLVPPAADVHEAGPMQGVSLPAVSPVVTQLPATESAQSAKAIASVVDSSVSTAPVESSNPSMMELAIQYCYTLYFVGVVLVMASFLMQLVYLWLLCRHHRLIDQYEGRIGVYELPATRLPFSFGRSVFIPTGLDGQTWDYVMKHELCHIRYHHFFWLCILQFLLAVNWFNPFVWLSVKEMRMQQELEADGGVISAGITLEDYQVSLVSMAKSRSEWCLSRLAFFSQPLKTRLLFMNTPLNGRHVRFRVGVAIFVACCALMLVTVFSCHTKELPNMHPLQGCWLMESYHIGAEEWERHYSLQQYKFYGHGGELVLSFSMRNGLNFYYQMSGMEQRVSSDGVLIDKHGTPLKYEMEGDNCHIWHWFPKKSTSNKEQIERWLRVNPDPHLLRLFREISATLEAKQPANGLVGVWLLDSLRSDDADTGREGSVQLGSPYYLIISKSHLYMRMMFKPNNNNRFLDFVVRGDCGELKRPNEHQVELIDDIVFEINSTPIANQLVLSSEISKPVHDWYFFHRVQEPEFLARLFRPALSK